MKQMTPIKKSRHNPRLLLFTTLGIIFLLLILASGFRVIKFAMARFADGFFYPYLKISTPSEKLSDSSLLVLDKGTLAARVEKLSHTNRVLALRGQNADALLEENRKLRNLLKLKPGIPRNYTIAGIVLRDPLHFKDGFTLDKGRRDGVLPGAAVVDVDDNGKVLLIGVISEAGARSSKVMTVSNPGLRISGEIASYRVIGFTHTGEIEPEGDNVPFGMLPVRDDYIQNSAVVTTGFENGIPAGIKIGDLHIANGRRSYEQEDYNCEIIPAVKFETLRFVAVCLIKDMPEALK